MKGIWKSLKDLKADTKYYMNLRKTKNLSELTIGEYLKSKQIKMDLIKFLPYSIFLTVPLAELFLPPYLLLFPNSLPSQFLTEKNVGERNNKFSQLQRDGAHSLYSKLESVLGADLVRGHQLA